MPVHTSGTVRDEHAHGEAEERKIGLAAGRGYQARFLRLNRVARPRSASAGDARASNAATMPDAIAGR
jgi:hypothetical protein